MPVNLAFFPLLRLNVYMKLSLQTKLFVTSGVIFIIIAALALLTALSTRPQNTPSKTEVIVDPQDKKNLLINHQERLALIRDFNRRIGRANASMQPVRLSYTFSPGFQKRLQDIESSKQAENVKAVSTLCNLSEVPDTVFAYILKGHWLESEARAIATKYGVESISYSQPTETSTYQYLYIRPDNMASFTLYESSGVYTYTKASTLAAGNLTADGLRRYASQILAQQNLDDRLNPPKFQTRGQITDFSYRRSLYDFMIVDEASIMSFFDKENCSITDSDLMGLITVSVKNNGEITRLVNNTRTEVDSFKMNTISIQEAEQEYRDAAPLDPIIFPSNATIDTSRPVNLDAAILAYFDVGLNFAQNMYIPMYIAHGFSRSTTGQEVQVLAFFPAVSARELAQKGVMRTVPLPGDRSTQQQGTFGFITPTPFVPPPFSRPRIEFGNSGPGCPGNTVEHMVSCSVEGRIVCRGTFSAPAAQDAMKACTEGCKGVVKTIDVSGGKNPCEAIMQQNGVSGSTINGEVPRQRIAPDGQVSCVITACPS